jgi:hypothetical protein
MDDRLGDHLRLGRGRPEALSLTWGEAVYIWHKRHGARPDPYHCTGCQGLLVGQPAMNIWDGARVHWDEAHGLDCLILYGGRWGSMTLSGREPRQEIGKSATKRQRAGARERQTRPMGVRLQAG